MRAAALLLVLPVLLQCQMPAQRLTPPRMDCAADGSVVNAITGEPIARAHVTSMPASLSTTTDGAGHWALTSIACGRAQITATKTGFLMGGLGAASIDGPFQPFTLTSDSPAHGLKLALTPQSVAVGKVIDEFGDPVLGVQVNALVSRVAEGRRTFINSSTARTDDLGVFRIAGLKAGRYIFCANAGFMPGVQNGANGAATYGDSCYPGPVDGGAASAMELPAGRETQINFTLRELQTFRVRGTLTGVPKGRGVALSLQSSAAAGLGMQGTVHQAIVLPDGSFEARGVPPGSYELICDYWEEGARLTAHVPVAVGGSDVEGVSVRLEPSFSLAGTVQVQSTAGKTLPNQPWAFTLRATDRARGGGGQIRWEKDRKAFTIADLISGNYTVDATPPAPFYVKSATLDGRDLTRDPILINRSGGQIEILLSDDAGSLEGTVEDADGQPPARAWVMLMRDGRPPRNVIASADGHFKIPNLAPGEYRVYGWNDVQQVEYADQDWMNRFARGQTVTVAPGQSASVKVIEQVIPVQ